MLMVMVVAVMVLMVVVMLEVMKTVMFGEGIGGYAKLWLATG